MQTSPCRHLRAGISVQASPCRHLGADISMRTSPLVPYTQESLPSRLEFFLFVRGVYVLALYTKENLPSIGWPVSQLAGWPASWPVSQLAGSLASWLAGQLAGWPVSQLAGWPAQLGPSLATPRPSRAYRPPHHLGVLFGSIVHDFSVATFEDRQCTADLANVSSRLHESVTLSVLASSWNRLAGHLRAMQEPLPLIIITILVIIIISHTIL